MLLFQVDHLTCWQPKLLHAKNWIRHMLVETNSYVMYVKNQTSIARHNRPQGKNNKYIMSNELTDL